MGDETRRHEHVGALAEHGVGDIDAVIGAGIVNVGRRVHVLPRFSLAAGPIVQNRRQKTMLIPVLIGRLFLPALVAAIDMAVRDVT